MVGDDMDHDDTDLVDMELSDMNEIAAEMAEEFESIYGDCESENIDIYSDEDDYDEYG